MKQGKESAMVKRLLGAFRTGPSSLRYCWGCTPVRKCPMPQDVRKLISWAAGTSASDVTDTANGCIYFTFQCDCDFRIVGMQVCGSALLHAFTRVNHAPVRHLAPTCRSGDFRHILIHICGGAIIAFYCNLMVRLIIGGFWIWDIYC